ncbi:restriction endonuclease subunit S [[Clostridium] polysaccharolyticum]|uniref:Type I restriction enzyme, S subunit n=1 Tax=[Clostridium] polysaccharolyticum TaxID=29364 RepID=A0A1I0CMK6_9FIRM|nr:restriction endonuclease subunit S [[Clostridium] polysaccharolyticum]SET20229.1 type I restriction enzyme, S subunit [[Clostridium] polysaccharolyticum]
MKYKRYVISDLLSEISMGPFGSNIKKECFVDAGIPVLNGSNLADVAMNDDAFRYVTEEKADSLGKANASRGDVVVTHRGTLGQISFIPSNSMYERYVISQSQFRFRCNEKVLPEYLVYYFHTRKGQHDLLSNASQVGVPALARATTTFQQLEVEIPEIEVQRKIVGILELLRNKIELNKEINKNLLQQMESIYKAWFIDYIPFNGKRPINWEKTSIYTIANIIYGAPFASKLFNTDGEGVPIIRIRDLKEQAFVTYTTEKHPKGHLIQPGDIVVGMDGEFRPYIWGNTEAWLNQRVCIFKNIRPKGKAFVLFTIKPLLFKIEQTQVATTVIHIGKKDYDAFEFYLPDEKTLNQFDTITYPMLEQVVVNSLENKRLSELRDSLLPRLMSGELDVSSLDL